MRVQDLQLFLSNFTKGSDAVKNAVPIIGQPGHTTHRLVMKTEKPSKIILPDKLQKDY